MKKVNDLLKYDGEAARSKTFHQRSFYPDSSQCQEDQAFGRGEWPLVGYVEKDDGEWVRTWRADGTFGIFPGEDDYDLVNTPKENFVWVNIYKCENEGLYCSFSHASSKEADDGSFIGRVGRLKIKLVEDQWDD